MRTQCTNNLKQLGIAVHTYNDAHKSLPSSTRPAGQTTAPRIAGMTFLLPYFEEGGRYQVYDQTVNWSNATNLPVTSKTISILLCPSSPVDSERLDWDPNISTTWNGLVACADYGATTGVDYRLGPSDHEPTPGKTGSLNLVDRETITYDTAATPIPNSGLLRKNAKAKLSDALDGTSKTILYAESAGRPYIYRKGKLVNANLSNAHLNGGGWSRPASDFHLDGASTDGATTGGPCAINCTNGESFDSYPHPHYGTEGSSEVYSFHVGGAHAVFADGSVQFISEGINIRQFARLVARSDGLIAPDTN